MIKDYLNYALQSLRHRRLRSWLTMIGIFIGIASVISLIGLGEGLRIAITSQFGFLGTDVLSVQASGLNYGPPGSGAVDPLKEELVDKIKVINGVDTAFGRIIQSGKMEFNGRQDIVFIISMPPGEDRKTVETILNLKTSEGRLLKDGDVKLLLGNDFTKDLEFGKGIHSGDRVILNDKRYEVVGIIEKKGSFIYDTAVYVNEDVVRDIFGDDGFYSVIAIKVKDTKNIESVKEAIEKLLRRERDVKKGEEDFSVQSPQKTLEALSSTLFAVNLFVYIIATISLVVGGIGIMNTMYTAVLERTKEIGIMKSIGARNSAIFTLFFIESGFLGLVGGILGILFGAGLAYSLAFFGRLALGSDLIRVSISPFLVIGALAFSFILGTLFGVLPAIRASKLRPVDALRSK
jgi:putative ABC transport system permease protein